MFATQRCPTFCEWSTEGLGEAAWGRGVNPPGGSVRGACRGGAPSAETLGPGGPSLWLGLLRPWAARWRAASTSRSSGSAVSVELLSSSGIPCFSRTSMTARWCAGEKSDTARRNRERRDPGGCSAAGG